MTIVSVVKSDRVVEGGAEIQENRRLFRMKNILITGKNSYIGTSLENWLMKESDKYKIDSIDMKDGSWKDADFSQYDVVFMLRG